MGGVKKGWGRKAAMPPAGLGLNKFQEMSFGASGIQDKKLSYHRMTARCVVSAEILPIATQQCRNYLYDKS